MAESQGRVGVVSFARPDQLKRFAEHLGLPFRWLADPTRLSYKHLGARRRGLMAIAPPRAIWGYIRLVLGGRIWRPQQLDLAQMGGDFVFDRSGNLTLSYVSTSSGDRPSVPAVVRAFPAASGAPMGAS